MELIPKKYDLWKSLPNSIKSHIELGKKNCEMETGRKKVIYLTMLRILLLK